MRRRGRGAGHRHSQQQHQRNHRDQHGANQPERVDIGEDRGLLLRDRVEFRLCLVQRTEPLAPAI